MKSDRRDTLRIPDSRLVTEIVCENPAAASIVNLSITGIYTVKPSPRRPLGPRKVQLEIPLPEASETIWAMGEVVFDRVARRNMGSGIRFKAMADCHHRLLRDLVEYRRQEVLSRMLEELKWRKSLAKHPSPFSAPPPPLSVDTVKMYLNEDPW
ncbi:MAG: PilZ domain-containing protein [Myxococcota bacterium]|jgi:hypothetical protein|nr:PilZ domain-containing protein [Myxococcota bacterium]